MTTEQSKKKEHHLRKVFFDILEGQAEGIFIPEGIQNVISTFDVPYWIRHSFKDNQASSEVKIPREEIDAEAILRYGGNRQRAVQIWGDTKRTEITRSIAKAERKRAQTLGSVPLTAATEALTTFITAVQNVHDGFQGISTVAMHPILMFDQINSFPSYLILGIGIIGPLFHAVDQTIRIRKNQERFQNVGPAISGYIAQTPPQRR